MYSQAIYYVFPHIKIISHVKYYTLDLFVLRQWKASTVSLTRSGGELLLASCSQDCLIRLWRLRAKSGTDARAEDDVLRMTEDVFEVTDGGESWKRVGPIVCRLLVLLSHRFCHCFFPVADVSCGFAVSLETVLAGHENWVYGVHWQPPVHTGSRGVRGRLVHRKFFSFIQDCMIVIFQSAPLSVSASFLPSLTLNIATSRLCLPLQATRCNNP